MGTKGLDDHPPRWSSSASLSPLCFLSFLVSFFQIFFKFFISKKRLKFRISLKKNIRYKYIIHTALRCCCCCRLKEEEEELVVLSSNNGGVGRNPQRVDEHHRH